MILKGLTKLIGDKDAARIITSFIVALVMISMIVISGNLLFN